MGIHHAVAEMQETVYLGHAGDEYAQTRNGNNNWYGHDNKMTRFAWDQLEKVKDTYFRFYRSALNNNFVKFASLPCRFCVC